METNKPSLHQSQCDSILAAYVTQAPVDINQLLVLLDRINCALSAAGLPTPKRTLADAGYCSTANIDNAVGTGHDLLVATGRLKHHERVPDAPKGPIPNDATSRERMARRLRTKAGRADYARRKAIIEPVFGQMKVKQNAGRLRLTTRNTTPNGHPDPRQRPN